jgi:drug/metabolite transporter (DMT)-like permease
LIAVLLSWLMLKGERLHVLGLLGILISVGGVVLLLLG